MAFFNEAWFVHQVSDNVTHLAQQKRSKTTGGHRQKEGVVGKSWPFQRLGTLEMEEVMQRDADTQYLNPPQSKRRCELRDFAAAVLVDSFDEVKELANAQSEFAQMLAYSRNRKIDRLAISTPIDGSGGGYLGLARTVDEGAETTSTASMPAAQKIANGGTGLTFAKVNQTVEIFNSNDVDEEDRYFYVSPIGIRNLLNQTKATSADFVTLRAIQNGGFPMDHTYMGMFWRMSTLLPKTGNIRTCIACQKMAVGAAFSAVKELEIDKAVHKNNSTQVLAKLSGNTVRIDDAGVISIDIDESAADPT